MSLTGRITFAAMLGACAPAGAVDISEKSTIYTVRGTSVAALAQDIRKDGPTGGSDKDRSPASASIQINPTVRVAFSKGACRIADVNVRVQIVYKRPRLSSVGRIDPTAPKSFNVLLSDIQAFQNEQRRIAISAAQGIEKSLPRLRAQQTCKAAESAWIEEFRRQIATHDNAQKKHIERWSKGLSAKLARAMTNAR